MILRSLIGSSAALLLAFVVALQAQDWRRPESRDRAGELVGFVDPQQLYWRPFVVSGMQQADFKLLSFDETTRARTILVRLPPGWKQVTGYHAFDLEMFIVEGGVEAGEHSMGRYAYAFYPAGYAHDMRTRDGAIVLQWWSGPPDFVASTDSKADTDLEDVVEGLNYAEVPFVGPADFPRFRSEPVSRNSPIRRKLLRQDKHTGQMTWISVIPGGGPAMSGEGDLPSWHSSPTWLEGFLIAGDMTESECIAQGQVAGTYRPGGYFFRPEGIRHGGPGAYSTTFAVWLYRSGGPYWLDYHEACKPPLAGKPGQDGAQK